jgi:hypothetical protein
VVYVNDDKQSEIQFTESLNNMLNLTVQETLLGIIVHYLDLKNDLILICLFTYNLMAQIV